MTSIYMLKKEIHFNEYPKPSAGDFSILTHQDMFYFPSNVLNCSLTVAQSKFNNFDTGDSGPATLVTILGSGIKDISYVGSQVYFAAWMQLLGIVESVENGLLPDASYMTVLAIAECE